MGVYVGGLIKNSAAVEILVQKLLTTVQARGIKERLLYQSCGEDGLYTMGIVADLNKGNLLRVQQDVRGWNEGKCVDMKGSVGSESSSQILTFPRPPPVLQPGLGSDILPPFNATFTNTTIGGSLRNTSETNLTVSRRGTSLPDGHGNVLQARAVCSSYRKVVAGDTCATSVSIKSPVAGILQRSQRKNGSRSPKSPRE